jgi:hypothetical protein
MCISHPCRETYGGVSVDESWCSDSTTACRCNSLERLLRFSNFSSVRPLEGEAIFTRPTLSRVVWASQHPFLRVRSLCPFCGSLSYRVSRRFRFWERRWSWDWGVEGLGLIFLLLLAAEAPESMSWGGFWFFSGSRFIVFVNEGTEFNAVQCCM